MQMASAALNSATVSSLLSYAKLQPLPNSSLAMMFVFQFRSSTVWLFIPIKLNFNIEYVSDLHCASRVRRGVTRPLGLEHSTSSYGEYNSNTFSSCAKNYDGIPFAQASSNAVSTCLHCFVLATRQKSVNFNQKDTTHANFIHWHGTGKYQFNKTFSISNPRARICTIWPFFIFRLVWL